MKSTARVAVGARTDLANALRKCAGPSRFLQKADLDETSGRLMLSLAFRRATILACVPSTASAPLDIALEPTEGGWQAAIPKASVRFAEPSAISRLDIVHCELRADADVADGLKLTLNGALSLRALPSSQEDLLSFEELVFFGLGLSISPDGTVAVDVSRLILDAPSSKTRKGSLCAQLRLVPKRLVSAKAGPLDAQGFESLDGAYAMPKTLDEPWHALVLGFNLGKLGELADSAELVTELAVGWGPPATPVFAAMKLPGSDLTSHVGLQGVVGLKPGGAGLRLHEEVAQGRRRWVVFLRDVKFSLFVLALPPNGGLDVEIAGDPNGEGPPSWYCAYGEAAKS